MADEPKKGSAIPETVIFVVGLIIVLVAIWLVRGAPWDNRMNGGIFLTPNGIPYGPSFGTTTPIKR